MDVVIQWVTQVILFLLLALVTDLLLPASSLRKYIKLVVGLLLILVFLQPLFHLFEVEVDTLFNNEMNQLAQRSQEEEMKNSIEVKKKEIQASQHAYILEQMAVQLKNEVREELIQDHGVTIQNLSFQLSEDYTDINLESLEHLVVVLSGSNNDAEETKQVDEIEEITINVDEPFQEKDTASSNSKIKKVLSTSWQISEDKLTIKWEGER